MVEACKLEEDFVAGLRERQKDDRQARIARAAKAMFLEHGFEKATIEGIAQASGVSGVTVHNYYGTKSGILLALVAENDRGLIAKLEDELTSCPQDVTEVTITFAKTIMEHALQNLQKVIWRQVIATVTANSDSSISKPYFNLDLQLAQVLVLKMSRMQDAGALPESITPDNLGRALFHLQNARFIQFVCSEQLHIDDVLQRIRNDLGALFAVQAVTLT
jgi:AcrR family transcriptional regulator